MTGMYSEPESMHGSPIFAVREPWHDGSFTEEAKREGHFACRRSNPAAGEGNEERNFLNRGEGNILLR